MAVWSGKHSSEVRREAAAALGKLGEHAAPAVPALTKCLADEDRDVRRGGLCALERSPAGAQLRESELVLTEKHCSGQPAAKRAPTLAETFRRVEIMLPRLPL